jgi:hypothetical protein
MNTYSHRSILDPAERVHKIVSVEYSEQALYSSCWVMRTRFDVLSRGAPRVLDSTQYHFLLGLFIAPYQ